MPRPLNKEARVRLNLAVSPTVKKRLEDLQSRTDADSLTEVVRKALLAYDRIVWLEERSYKLMIEGADGEDLGQLWPMNL